MVFLLIQVNNMFLSRNFVRFRAYTSPDAVKQSTNSFIVCKAWVLEDDICIGFKFILLIIYHYIYIKHYLRIIQLNLQDRDNLRTKDKRPVPKVSFVRRFDCIRMKYERGLVYFVI